MKIASEAGTPTFGMALEDPAQLPTPKEHDDIKVCIGEPWYPDERGAKKFVIPFQIHIFDARVQLSGKGGEKQKLKIFV